MDAKPLMNQKQIKLVPHFKFYLTAEIAMLQRHYFDPQ